MRLLPLETLPPEENMRRDEEILLALEEGSGEPSLRFYRWSEVCLSLGHFQKEKEGLSLPVVRRPTGGGALLHGWDVSFSLVDYKDRWGVNPSSIYRNVSEVFRRSFDKLGVRVNLERFKGRYLDRFFCFWVPTLGELTWNGRKIVSMAMRTLRKSFLIHGSVYVNFDYKEASRLLRVPEEFLRRRIVSLKELRIEEDRFVRTLRNNFLLTPEIKGPSLSG